MLRITIHIIFVVLLYAFISPLVIYFLTYSLFIQKCVTKSKEDLQQLQDFIIKSIFIMTPLSFIITFFYMGIHGIAKYTATVYLVDLPLQSGLTFINIARQLAQSSSFTDGNSGVPFVQIFIYSSLFFVTVLNILFNPVRKKIGWLKTIIMLPMIFVITVIAGLLIQVIAIKILGVNTYP